MAVPTLRSTVQSSSASQTGVVVQAGDLILVGWTDDTNSTTGIAITDNASGGSNTYYPLGSILNHTVSPIFNQAAFYAFAKGAATLTISGAVTGGTATGGQTIDVDVYYNVGAYELVGATPLNETTAVTSHTIPAVSNANANDLLVSYINQYTSGSTSWADTAGFTSNTVSSDGFNYKVASAPGSQGDTGTTSVAVQYLGLIAVFSPTGLATGGTAYAPGVWNCATWNSKIRNGTSLPIAAVSDTGSGQSNLLLRHQRCRAGLGSLGTMAAALALAASMAGSAVTSFVGLILGLWQPGGSQTLGFGIGIRAPGHGVRPPARLETRDQAVPPLPSAVLQRQLLGPSGPVPRPWPWARRRTARLRSPGPGPPRWPWPPRRPVWRAPPGPAAAAWPSNPRPRDHRIRPPTRASAPPR